MKKFYFYAAVNYPPKSFEEIPKGSIGLHYIEAETEEIAKDEFDKKYKQFNDSLYVVDMFGKEIKFNHKWYGELKK